MAKRNEFAGWNGFQGIRCPAKIGKFDQRDILAQFIDDRANLSFS